MNFFSFLVDVVRAHASGMAACQVNFVTVFLAALTKVAIMFIVRQLTAQLVDFPIVIEVVLRGRR